MPITIGTSSISKPVGKSTPAATLTYSDLIKYIFYWHKVVGPLLAASRISIDTWRNSGRSSRHIHEVLRSIIVTFGEGSPRPWDTHTTLFLSHATNLRTSNAILSTVDTAITDFTPTAIHHHFTALRGIRGLGSHSYGSKVLRCLSDGHVVFDNRIENELVYTSYTEFRDDCVKIATALGLGFDPADVEGGLFVWIQLLLPPGRGHSRWAPFKNIPTAGKNIATSIAPIVPVESTDSVPPTLAPNCKSAPIGAPRGRVAVSIRNAGRAYFGIHEGPDKAGGNIGYIGKGADYALNRGGHIVAYSRLLQLLAAAGYPLPGHPPLQHVAWLAGGPPAELDLNRTIETHHLPSVPLVGHGPIPANTCARKDRNIHCAFFFLEKYFNVYY